MKFVKNNEKFSLSALEGDGCVAFFDSGVGGLNVLFSCVRRGLTRPMLYFGDNARAPYGNLSEETVRAYTREAFDLFEKYGVQCAVIACNTATAVCFREFSSRYSFPILGTVPPIERAKKIGNRILVLATKRTVESPSFQNICAHARVKGKVEVVAVGLPTLAKEIENRLFSLDEICLAEHLPPLKKGFVPDVVVLGCTHYSFLKRQFQNYFHVPVLDSSDDTAKAVFSLLGEKVGDGQPFLTTNFQNYAILPENGQNENVCSEFCSKIAQKPEIRFLGSGKSVNLQKYEQMFVQFVEKNRGGLAKNPKNY